jgi:hypothetical protein
LKQVPLLVLKVRADDVFAGRAHRHAIGRFVVGPVAQALPHRGRLGLIDAPAVVEGVARIGDLLYPVGEAAEKFAIIVGEAGGKVERAVRADRSNWTGRYAQLALEARVVLDGVIVTIDLKLSEHGAQQDEVAELRVDEIAVNAHVPEPSFHRDGFVREHPGRVGGRVIHLHGEAHGGIDGAGAARLELGNDLSPDMVDLVTGSMEFQICDRSRGAANWLARHAHHEADQHFRPGIVVEDLVALRIKAGAGDLDEACIIGAALNGKLA